MFEGYHNHSHTSTLRATQGSAMGSAKAANPRKRPSATSLFQYTFRWADAVLLVCICILHVYLAPYTKVEESFNVQATFDLLYKRWIAVTTFDHRTFPGVVPRTFLAPILLYIIVAPFRMVFRPLATFYALRLVLALLSVCAQLAVRGALIRRYGKSTGVIYTIMTCVQFHLNFYAGRPLANMLALLCTNVALALRIDASDSKNVLIAHAVLGAAVALLRSELCLLLLWTMVYDVYMGLTNPLTSMLESLISASISAVLSVVVDTYFWAPNPELPLRFRYPELEVFYFNAIQGRSSAWGISPLHWYFTNALPRALGPVLLLALLALVLQQTRTAAARAFVPALAFVATYSLLPHKELRFILYALPAANAAAAHVGALLWRIVTKKRSAVLLRLLSLGVLCACIGTSALLTLVSTAASHTNYPGAQALLTLSQMDVCNTSATIHVDAHAASTGISQFVEAHVRLRCIDWTISREESLSDIEIERRFTHLLASREFVPGFRVIYEQNAFQRVDVRNARLLQAPDLFIHQRVHDAALRTSRNSREGEYATVHDEL